MMRVPLLLLVFAISCSLLAQDTYNITVDDQGNIVLPTKIKILFFASGSTELDARSLEILYTVSQVLQMADDVEVHIRAHADAEEDRVMSAQRGLVVKSFLMEQWPGLEDRIIVTDHGKERPIETNATETGRARNRYVEMNYGYPQED